MLARYKMYRGSRPDDDPLPDGIRQDTRKHTRHCLRPATEIVLAYQAAPSAAAWQTFQSAYQGLLETRFDDDRTPFDTLAGQAAAGTVYIGCSCPTAANPNVDHCHTVLALSFMEKHYPELTVVYP
jgi:hypothetical protein